MIIKYKDEDYNLYSLVLKEAEKMYVLPILSKLEKFKLHAEIRFNLIKRGFFYLMVPEGKGKVRACKLDQNMNWYIC